MDHMYSDILIGEPIDVAHDYQLIPLVKVELYANDPIVRITYIPMGLILICKHGIQYQLWSQSSDL